MIDRKGPINRNDTYADVCSFFMLVFELVAIKTLLLIGFFERAFAQIIISSVVLLLIRLEGPQRF